MSCMYMVHIVPYIVEATIIGLYILVHIVPYIVEATIIGLYILCHTYNVLCLYHTFNVCSILYALQESSNHEF